MTPRRSETGFTSSGRYAEHGFTSPGRYAEHGFTLVEVMVSLLIFAMLAAAGVAILSFSVRAQGVTAARLDDDAALARTLSVLSADLAQAQARPTRDEGGTVHPAFVGEGSAAALPMLRMTRGGWSNIDAAPRASSQKVEYRVTDGVLQRVAYPMLDGAAALPPAAMLGHVRALALRYRYRGAWSERWDGTQGAVLPQAMEMRVVRDDGVELRQLFLVGTGHAPPPVEPTGGA